MKIVSRSRGVRSALSAVALAGLLALAPASAGAADAKNFGVGAACALSNIVYGPVKLIYALLGGVTAGLGYALTAGDIDVTRTILDTSVNGDYVVEPAHLRGEKPLQFIGSSLAAAPPQDDWGNAQNSGF
jgi:type IV secretory pathway VirB2 component (pilin)